MSKRKARLRGKDRPPAATRDTAAPPPLGLTLGLAFAISGVAGLVYELTWTRYLALLVGHSAFAQLLPPPILLDAAIAAYLGAGRPESARAAFDALAPKTGRPAGHVRNLVLDALVRAALGVAPVPFPASRGG